MQAIFTKYFGPGNVRVSRIIARSTSGVSSTWEYDDKFSTEENHARAARRLALRLAWWGTWVAGSLGDKGGNVYVCINRPEPDSQFHVPKPEPGNDAGLPEMPDPPIYVQSFGKAVRIVAIARNSGESNAYMEANPGTGVIDATGDFTLIAPLDDLGREFKD